MAKLLIVHGDGSTGIISWLLLIESCIPLKGLRTERSPLETVSSFGMEATTALCQCRVARSSQSPSKSLNLTWNFDRRRGLLNMSLIFHKDWGEMDGWGAGTNRGSFVGTVKGPKSLISIVDMADDMAAGAEKPLPEGSQDVTDVDVVLPAPIDSPDVWFPSALFDSRIYGSPNGTTST